MPASVTDDAASLSSLAHGSLPTIAHRQRRCLTGPGAPATVSPRVLATMRCPSRETSRRCCDADTIRNANREHFPDRSMRRRQSTREGGAAWMILSSAVMSPLGRQCDQSRALPQDGQVGCADVGHIQRLQRDQLLQASQILNTGMRQVELAQGRARCEVRYRLQLLTLAEVQLVQPGQEREESGEAFVGNLSTLQAELAECHTAQQAAQIITSGRT
jgi:hypothetical protein